ncbi:MAG: hypothetical protein KBC15_04040 [Candidatus Levybacteria bacterium]|nr:hypothetical protein [Candidatus Levybacteria bacterium]
MIKTDPAIVSSFPFRVGRQIESLQTTMGWNTLDLATALGMRIENARRVVAGMESLPEHALQNLESQKDKLPLGTIEMLKAAMEETSEVFDNHDGLAFLFWFINNQNEPLSMRQEFMDKIDSLARSAEHIIRGTFPDGATE